jgi:hypothetical protein
MQRLEVSCAVRPIYGSLGAKGLMGSGHPHPSLGCMSFTVHCHLVQRLRISVVIRLLRPFAYMTCKGTTLCVSKLVRCPQYSAIMLWNIRFTCFVTHCVISVRNWMCFRIPFWTFNSRCSVDLSASASHRTLTVFRFLFI